MALLVAIAHVSLCARRRTERQGRDAQGTRYSPARRSPARTSPPRSGLDVRIRRDRPPVQTKKATRLRGDSAGGGGHDVRGHPLGRVIALDPLQGASVGCFRSKIKRDVEYGDFASRGVSHLARCPPRRRRCHADIRGHGAVATVRAGCPGWPALRRIRPEGHVDLTAGLRIPPCEPGAYSMTSPP